MPDNGAMVTLLIADDEEKTRNSLAGLIPWEENGIRLAGCTENGQQALEHVRAAPVDILLTDVRMPVMDGLALVKALREAESETRCIILSGHDEFSYAQQAIAHGVDGYLLKPCSSEEILQCVCALKQDILFEREHRNSFAQELPFLRERYLTSLLLGMEPFQDLREKFRFVGLDMDYGWFTVALLSIRVPMDNRHSEKTIEMVRLNVLHALTQDAMPDAQLDWVAAGGDYAALIRHNSPLDFARIETVAEACAADVQTRFGLQTTLSFGNSYVGGDFVENSYREARDMHSRHYFGPPAFLRVYRPGEEQPGGPDLVQALEEMERAILQGDRERLNIMAGRLVQNVSAEGGDLKKLFSLYKLWGALIQFGENAGVDLSPMFTPDTVGIARKDLPMHIARVQDGTMELSRYLIEKLAGKRRANTVLNQAMDYIEDNYAQADLSRESLAAQVFVSPTYLSTLFRKGLGMSLTDYLNGVRIRNAAKMLQQGDFKVYQVAQRVGYNDERYFSQVFKKILGVSPNEYRKTRETGGHIYDLPDRDGQRRHRE